MKRGTPDHPKTRRLMRLLSIETWQACGILETLWHFTAKHAIRGDIGRWTDEEIAEGIGWTKDASELVSALVESRWLDRSDKYRLIVHDWHDHADDSVKKTLKNRGETFVTFEANSEAFRKVPESSGKFLPALPSLATPSPAHPSHTEPTPNGNGVGWGEISEMLAKRNVVDFNVRPVDETATPHEVKSLIEVWDANKGDMQCTEPHALLVKRIREHKHGMKAGIGWPTRKRS